MFEKVKKQISKFIVRRSYHSKVRQIINFNNFVKDSIDYLFLMPEDDADFRNCFDLIRYFIIHKKNVTIFLPEHKYNLIPQKDKYKIITYNLHEVTKFSLPTHSLIENIKRKSFDIVIDLNRDEHIYYEAIINVIDSLYRVGFTKTNSDKYYNFQVADDRSSPEIAYRKLLESLLMF